MLRAAETEIRSLAEASHQIILGFEKELGGEEYPGEEPLTAAIAKTLTTALCNANGTTSTETRFFVTHKQNEEPSLGADLLIINSFHSTVLQVSKGILVQAKMLENGKAMPGSDKMQELRDQCANMLKHTQQSYVWLYDGPPVEDYGLKNRRTKTQRHFRVIRASLIKHLNNNYPDQLHYHFPYLFIYHLMMGFIGDESIHLSDFERLARLIRRSGVRYVLLISTVAGPEFRPSIEKHAPKPPYAPPPDIEAAENLIKHSLGSLDESFDGAESKIDGDPDESLDPTPYAT